MISPLPAFNRNRNLPMDVIRATKDAANQWGWRRSIEPRYGSENNNERAIATLCAS
jgi:hypothetical protein